jgi:hypothetical protein
VCCATLATGHHTTATPGGSCGSEQSLGSVVGDEDALKFTRSVVVLQITGVDTSHV